MLFAHHWISEARLRSLLSLMFSAMLIISNAIPFVQVASAASGDFSIDFTAAAPRSYNHLTGGGAYDDRTIGVRNDVVESLEGGDFSSGDIVTFFATVRVGDTQSAINDGLQTIEMDFSFLADSTGQSGTAFGDIVDVKVNYNAIEDLIPGENTIDDGIKDDGGSVATLTSETFTGPLFTSKSELHGTVKLDDLEAGEQVVVRIDVKLFCKPGSTPTGNLQADLTDARLIFISSNTPATGAISGGSQTIPLKQINYLRTPELDIQKTVTTADGTCPGVETLTVTTSNKVKYCYMVSNPGDAPLYNVNVIDDAGTPSNKADDFTVTLSSGLTDIGGDGDADDLAAGGTATGTAMVTLSITGTIVNTATAEGDDSIIEPTTFTDNDTATVIVEGIPSYTINKTIEGVKNPDNSPDADGIVDEAGDIIHYKILINNNGSSPLTGVMVTDPLVGALAGPTGDNAPLGILDAGETRTYTGNYTVTQEDINNNGIAADGSPDNDGDIDNTATVDCNELSPLDDSEAALIEWNAAYIVDKTITDVAGKGPLGSVTKAGDVIAYQITVTNDGNIDLTNVIVTDSLIALAGPVESLNADGVLEVGEIWTYIGAYTVTQEDIDANGGYDGYIDNVAIVECDQLEPKSDSARVPIEATPVFEPCPEYRIEKCVTDVDCRGPNANVTGAGDVITYRITVTNTGDVDLTNVVVTDPLIVTLKGPAESKNANGILDTGEKWTYTGCYVVTQEDIDTNRGCDGHINTVAMVNCDIDTSKECDGYIDNVATVDCNQLGPKSDSVRVMIEKISTEEESIEEDSTEEDQIEEVPTEKKQDYCIYKSIIGVDQAGDCIINKPGDIIEYQIVVKNEGNADLTGVSVSDPMITLTGPTGDDINPGVLNPGEIWKFIGNYMVTQADINSNGGGDGFIENTATVNCNELPDESSSVKQPIVLTSADSANSNDGANSNGGTGSAHVISKPAKNVEVKGNTAEETGTEIMLEPEIKSFEQKTGNTEGDAEKAPEQKESTGMPGFVIYGIIGLLAILLFILLHKRK